MGYKWGNYFLTWGQVVLDNHHIKTAFCIYADKYAKKKTNPRERENKSGKSQKKSVSIKLNW